jgi:hypothetical protein
VRALARCIRCGAERGCDCVEPPDVRPPSAAESGGAGRGEAVCVCRAQRCIRTAALLAARDARIDALMAEMRIAVSNIRAALATAIAPALQAAREEGIRACVRALDTSRGRMDGASRLTAADICRSLLAAPTPVPLATVGAVADALPTSEADEAAVDALVRRARGAAPATRETCAHCDHPVTEHTPIRGGKPGRPWCLRADCDCPAGVPEAPPPESGGAGVDEGEALPTLYVVIDRNGFDRAYDDREMAELAVERSGEKWGDRMYTYVPHSLLVARVRAEKAAKHAAAARLAEVTRERDEAMFCGTCGGTGLSGKLTCEACGGTALGADEYRREVVEAWRATQLPVRGMVRLAEVVSTLRTDLAETTARLGALREACAALLPWLTKFEDAPDDFFVVYDCIGGGIATAADLRALLEAVRRAALSDTPTTAGPGTTAGAGEEST